MKKTLFILILFILLTFINPRPTLAAFFSVDLGTLGGQYSSANDINNIGQIVGYGVTASGHKHAVLWQANGTKVDLGTLGGQNSEARGINDLGEIVGWSETGLQTSNGFYIRHPFLWRNGVMIDLGSLGGDDSSAYSINNTSQIVGYSGMPFPKGGAHAFLWESGTLIDLDQSGGNQSIGMSINNGGDIVGRETNSNLVCRSGKWITNIFYSLQPILNTEFRCSLAQSINNLNQIVGYSDPPLGSNASLIPVIWENGIPTELESLGGTLGGPGGVATDINDNSIIVGSSPYLNPSTGRYNQHAVFWKNKKIIDLSPATAIDEGANAINNNNQIVGERTNSQGFPRATLWLLDTTPPQITVPADITTNATSAAGAQVAYTVTVKDDFDPSPQLTCTPLSNTIFPIGATTITCTASDTSGNTSQATFHITVKGACDQLTDLVQLINSFNLDKGIETSLIVKVQDECTSTKATKPNFLVNFINEVAALTDKKMTLEQGNILTTAANRIKQLI